MILIIVQCIFNQSQKKLRYFDDPYPHVFRQNLKPSKLDLHYLLQRELERQQRQNSSIQNNDMDNKSKVSSYPVFQKAFNVIRKMEELYGSDQIAKQKHSLVAGKLFQAIQTMIQEVQAAGAAGFVY